MPRGAMMAQAIHQPNKIVTRLAAIKIAQPTQKENTEKGTLLIYFGQCIQSLGHRDSATMPFNKV